MREIRILAPASCYEAGAQLILNDEASHHLLKVLRLKEGTPVTIFNGAGLEARTILSSANKSAAVTIQELVTRNTESPLKLELGQVISKGDRMEYILQKATELGVSAITPLLSKHCAVKLDDKRQERKLLSWQKIVNNACEQCGRNVVPKVHEIKTLEEWAGEGEDALNLILDPRSDTKLSALQGSPGRIRLITGPEGGFADEEIAFLLDEGFAGVTLGPRILRTETAPIAALAILGAKFGDL